MFACAHPALDAGVGAPLERHAMAAYGASDILSTSLPAEYREKVLCCKSLETLDDSPWNPMSYVGRSRSLTARKNGETSGLQSSHQRTR